ncbi:MBL fold metallo-hydrolase [Hyphomicrobium sp. CS1BSMeth3]|uniref:MBL fold metallo-hydrolase n=1 Tax=Hyphomicrobium sp. CS1BSMeth3 TaxID=1892844 RepID=UPI000931C4C9|nr:MBL fold metallo-hydrolase [Hyphomicrobium sp. CS1BSMeth3]
MAQFSRRQMIAGSLSAAALAPVCHLTPARAAAPQIGKQAPGFYRYRHGDFEVTAVTDGAIRQPLADSYVVNASRDQVNAALGAMHLERDRIFAPLTPVVINTGTRLVVIDTGLGPAAFEQSKGAGGQFHTNLRAAGIDAAAVDAVVLSHLHRDHVGGLLTKDGHPAFPNAEIFVPAADWRFWSDDGNLTRMTAGSIPEINFRNNKQVFASLKNRVTLYDADKEVQPGILSVPAYGHTPGHTAHLVTSGNAKVLLQADLTAFSATLFVANPGWHVFFDMDGAAAESSRRRIYDMAASEKLLVQGYHLPFPSLGQIERQGSAYRFVPATWNSSL